MRRAFVTSMLLAMTSGVAAEPRRDAWPHAVTGGVAVIVPASEPMPFLTAQGVVDLDARFSAVGDFAYTSSSDRLFGPRLLVRAGIRAYLGDGRWNPFVAVGGVVYHELDVDYDRSDSSQQASTALGAGVTLGNELVTVSQFTWVFEVTVFQLESIEGTRLAPEGLGGQVDTMMGFRF